MQKSIIVSLVFYAFCSLSFGAEPVTYGGDQNLDACASFGHVANLSKTSDGFLAVKDSPNIKTKRIDKIFNDQKVWICSESKDGKWFGIVYSTDSQIDCKVTENIKVKKPYNGPCKSGWVASKWVTIDAG
jgi:hypothetical protein